MRICGNHISFVLGWSHKKYICRCKSEKPIYLGFLQSNDNAALSIKMSDNESSFIWIGINIRKNTKSICKF